MLWAKWMSKHILSLTFSYFIFQYLFLPFTASFSFSSLSIIMCLSCVSLVLCAMKAKMNSNYFCYHWSHMLLERSDTFYPRIISMYCNTRISKILRKHQYSSIVISPVKASSLILPCSLDLTLPNCPNFPCKNLIKVLLCKKMVAIIVGPFLIDCVK